MGLPRSTQLRGTTSTPAKNKANHQSCWKKMASRCKSSQAPTLSARAAQDGGGLLSTPPRSTKEGRHAQLCATEHSRGSVRLVLCERAVSGISHYARAHTRLYTPGRLPHPRAVVSWPVCFRMVATDGAVSRPHAPSATIMLPPSSLSYVFFFFLQSIIAPLLFLFFFFFAPSAQVPPAGSGASTMTFA